MSGRKPRIPGLPVYRFRAGGVVELDGRFIGWCDRMLGGRYRLTTPLKTRSEVVAVSRDTAADLLNSWSAAEAEAD